MKNSYLLKLSLKLLNVAAIGTLVLLLAACGTANPPAASPTTEGGQALVATTDTGATTAEEGYPPPAPAPDTAAAYPAEGETAAVLEAYPPPAVDQAFKEPRFSFDLPVEADATTVSGQAPPDVALAIADLTFNGAILGSGRSDSDGRFSISVSPLPDGHRIGVTVAELQPGQTISDMSAAYYPHRGDGFMNLPNIGVFFETALVEP
jgi:hypothetical protein